MRAGGTPMSNVSRPRTRSQWDEHYRYYYNEMKRNDRESGGIGGRHRRVRNVINSESIVVKGDGGKSWEKQDFVIVGEKRGGDENIEHARSSGRRGLKRTRNVVQEFAGSRNVGGHARKRIEEEKDNNVASVGRVLRGKKKLDVRAKNDGDGVLESDDEVECFGEEVVSNGSSLKIGPESRSGSGSKVGNLDEVVSCITKRVGNTRVGADNGGSGGQRASGRPRIKPLDGKHISHDVSVELENSIDSGNSTKRSDGSDESVDLCLFESESTSEEDDEFSDEDYKADEPSTSESSDVSYYGSDVKQENDDEYDAGENENLMNGEEENSSDAIEDKTTLCTHRKSTRKNEKKESDTEQENNDESDRGYNGDVHGSSLCKRSSNQQKQEDVVIIINDKEKFPSVRRSTRISEKEKSEVEQERDDDIDKSCHATHDDSYRNKTSANWRKVEDVVIIIDDEEKFPSIRIQKGEGGLAGLARICEPHSSYDKARKDGDNSGSFTARNISKQVNVNLNESGLSKRKVYGYEILVGSDKNNDKEETSLAKFLRSSTISKCQKKEPELGKFSSAIPIPESGESASSMDDEFKSLRDKDSCHIERVAERGQQCLKKVVKLGKTRQARNLDLIKILVESINSLKEQQSSITEYALTQKNLPLKFRFEDEVQPPHKKSEWEKQMDSLFCDLELGLRESEIDCTNFSVVENDDFFSTEIDQSPAACCGRGEHQLFLDEQIGIVCKYCSAVILDIKYVLPPFYTPPLGRRDRKDSDESPSSVISQIQFQDSACGTPDSTSRAKGTVWDLIAGVEKEMYPHQREGFEFMWKNIAGDIIIEKLKQPLSDDAMGCIISHAPGTGKTRLTIVFLMTFLRLYPTCRPVIIAPRGMLLTWESEFIKWNVDIPFHNLNKKELSENDNALAAEIIGQVGGGGGGMSRDCIRLLKLTSWIFGRGILGISYQLFEKLAGENGKEGLKEQIRKLLLEYPGLLVLDEGHTPRNDQSLIWKALTKVATQRRIILSGTPFQNNLTELYNTLCLVNPKIVNQSESENKTTCKTRGQKNSVARKKWATLTSSIGKNTDDGLKKLRDMLDPFVHVHKGTILQESLLGLRDTIVFLHPTELQKTLLENSSKARNIFHRIRLVSLVSVHPSLMADMRRSSAHKSKLEEIESDVDAGVKTKFVMKLLWLADALGERVLVFSQFIDPLVFIKKLIKSHFSWNEGRELLYMDGKLDEKQRQDSISSFNDDASEAKVLLASERACSEGISLVGASRVVLLDTVWNPSVEKQAISRAYRLGQKKVVYVYRLFTSGTEVRQYAQQVQKKRISQLIFSPVDGQTCQGDKSPKVSEDKVLEAMLHLERFSHIFEKIIHQPKESDLIEIFGLVDRK